MLGITPDDTSHAKEPDQRENRYSSAPPWDIQMIIGFRTFFVILSLLTGHGSLGRGRQGGQDEDLDGETKLLLRGVLWNCLPLCHKGGH